MTCAEKCYSTQYTHRRPKKEKFSNSIRVVTCNKNKIRARDKLNLVYCSLRRNSQAYTHIISSSGADPYRFSPFYGNRSDILELLRNSKKGTQGIKKSIAFPKETRPWTPLEGTRWFGNRSPFILDPRPKFSVLLLHEEFLLVKSLWNTLPKNITIITVNLFVIFR